MRYIRNEYGDKTCFKINKHGEVFDENKLPVKIYTISTRLYKGETKQMKPRPYVYVKYRDGIFHKKQLGRWLLLTYKPIKHAEKFEVNHIDGDPCNNTLDNLEWVTRRENMMHAADNNLLPYGENHHNSKYKDSLIHEICQDIIDGLSSSEIQIRHGVNNQLVNDIKSGRSHKKISKLYIDKGFVYTKKTKDEDIKLAHKICKMIEKGMTNKDIVNKLKLKNTCLPNDIRKKRVYKYVSEQYKI